METTRQERTPKQALFRELVLGTLVYSVVLGFFNDYTSILQTRSYSITFAVAFVMEVLTYSTFGLKKIVANHFRAKDGKQYKFALVFFVWLIMFLSKFVFLAVLDFIFGDLVEISGFFGLLAIILVMTIVKEGVDYIYLKLGNT